MATALLLAVVLGLSKMPWAVVLFVALVPLVLGACASATERRRVRRAYGDYEVQTQAARSEAFLVVEADPEAVKDAVRRAATDRFRLVGERGEELILLRRMNLATWGMTARVTVAAHTQGTRIHVREEPRLGTTIYDWGQGRRDIVLLLDRIGEQLTGPVSPAE
ncbi:hypothetical protein [Kocuria varians]|uniref:hypothetical protein n=1 Tax=Kocuria varians TaxID=1272 RepID=UPI000838171D|nr:hypothetical protein [Kocuria varians]